MKTTKPQRLALAAKMRELRPAWSQDQLVIAITAAADRAETLPQLNCIGLLIARTPSTHPRSIIDDFDTHAAQAANLAATAADATAMTTKPSKDHTDPYRELRNPDGTTDPARQSAYIRRFLGIDNDQPADTTLHDGYSLARSVGLDEHIPHPNWDAMTGLERATAINTWCRLQPTELARDDAGLTLMLDVKADSAAAVEHAAERRAQEKTAQVEWDRKTAGRRKQRAQ